jgi:hypothetical protein
MSGIDRFSKEQLRQFARRYEEHGFVSIRSFLPRDLALDVLAEIDSLSKLKKWKRVDLRSADYVYTYYRFPVIWNFRVSRTVKEKNLSSSGYNKVLQVARKGFKRPPTGNVIYKLEEFFTSEKVRDFLFAVTRSRSLHFPMVSLTEFRAGDELSKHADANGVAYSLGLTRKWDESWGGGLTFYKGDSNKVVKRYSQQFNRMIIFKTPRYHAVEPVKKSAKVNRHVASGWFFEPK